MSRFWRFGLKLPIHAPFGEFLGHIFPYDVTHHPNPSGQILRVAIVLANAYQRTKFQLSRSITFGDMRGSQNKKWELLISPRHP